MDHDAHINQGFLEDWLINWIKAIHKGEDKKLVSINQTIMVSSFVTKFIYLYHGTNDYLMG